MRRSHSIRFTRAQGISMYKIGLGGERMGELGKGCPQCPVPAKQCQRGCGPTSCSGSPVLGTRHLVFCVSSVFVQPFAASALRNLGHGLVHPSQKSLQRLQRFLDPAIGDAFIEVSSLLACEAPSPPMLLASARLAWSESRPCTARPLPPSHLSQPSYRAPTCTWDPFTLHDHTL